MEPVDLFYSYAHEDEVLRDELAGHLKIMERRGVIRPWHDRSIAAGQKWDRQISEHLLTADLVLLLISKDFINSDYIWSHELDVVMKRQEQGEASVVPVMLRVVDIADAPFATLQGLPLVQSRRGLDRCGQGHSGNSETDSSETRSGAAITHTHEGAGSGRTRTSPSATSSIGREAGEIRTESRNTLGDFWFSSSPT